MSRRASGFTLVEILVAMLIFAIMGTMAYAGLDSVVQQRTRNEDVMKRLRQVQLAMSIMSRDFAQLVPRPVRNDLGSSSGPLLANPDNVPPIVFTRGGWSNPLGLTRSTQERVAYSLEDGKLMRSFWPELDVSVAAVPVKQVLLPDVTAVKIMYADASGQFQDVWPETGANGAPPAITHSPAATGNNALPQFALGGSVLPQAVSITLTLKDWGSVTRIVEVAGVQQ